MSAPRIVLAMVVATVIAALALARLGGSEAPLPGAPGVSRLAREAPSPPAGQAALAPATPATAPADTRGSGASPAVAPTASQPTLAVAPRAAGPGARVTLTGAGFAPSARLAATLVGAGEPNGWQLSDVKSGADGALSAAVSLPVGLAPGRYTLRLAGSESAQADVWVVDGEPRLDLHRYAAHPGELLGLAGTGFAPGETVRIYLADAPAETLGELTADARGAIASQGIPVPAVPAGVRTLVAEGEQTGLAVRREVSIVEHAPWIVLSVYALRPGGSVDVAGHDFAPGEQVKAFLDDGPAPVWTGKADDAGSVVARALFTAGPDGVGKHRLALAGDATRAPVSATFEVLPYVPRLALTSYAGPPGAGVAFDGVGFAPGETVRVFLDRGAQRDQVATITVGASGAFQGMGAYVVPGQAAVGRLHFVAIGDASRVAVSQDYDVQALAPWAELSAYSGAVDAPLSFRGHGFSPGERVDVHLGSPDGPVLGSAAADSHGALGWSGPLSLAASLPADAGTAASLFFVGASSGSSAQAEYDVVAPAAVASR